MKQPSDMTDRELDAAVAVEVMKWPHRPPGFGGPRPPHVAEFVDGTTMVRTPNCNDWRPSADIAAAWEVVEKMRTEGYGFILTDCPAYVCAFDLDSSVEWRSKADTAPRAICLAALAAVRGRK